MSRLAEAEPVLRSLAERQGSVAEDDAAWARRSLALALALGGDYGRYPEALRLVGLRLDAKNNPIEETTNLPAPAVPSTDSQPGR